MLGLGGSIRDHIQNAKPSITAALRPSFHSKATLFQAADQNDSDTMYSAGAFDGTGFTGD